MKFKNQIKIKIPLQHIYRVVQKNCTKLMTP